MAALLLSIKAQVAEINPHCDHLEPEKIADYENRYDEIVKLGFEMNPQPPQEKTTKKRGKAKKNQQVNLLFRLRDYKPQVLAFMYDASVPFDNNQAERDVRMVKVKQKVSGGFRTKEGASLFGRIRGYISTARKNSKNVFEAINSTLLDYN